MTGGGGAVCPRASWVLRLLLSAGSGCRGRPKPSWHTCTHTNTHTCTHLTHDMGPRLQDVYYGAKYEDVKEYGGFEDADFLGELCKPADQQVGGWVWGERRAEGQKGRHLVRSPGAAGQRLPAAAARPAETAHLPLCFPRLHAAGNARQGAAARGGGQGVAGGEHGAGSQAAVNPCCLCAGACNVWRRAQMGQACRSPRRSAAPPLLQYATLPDVKHY